MKSLPRPLLALCVAAALPLAACSQEAQQSEATITADEEQTTTASASNEAKEDEGVSEARETFGSLVPASVFDDFDSCKPAGVKNSMDCSGPKVGQFQFSKSESKAASMTQLLTELRSARVVKDTGRAVVGWNTLGNTAVITVVDNDEGTVAQQMTSMDQDDPEDRIKELNLLEAPAVLESEKESESAAPSSEASASEASEANSEPTSSEEAS
ncbi:hypothetical protein [Corynebacterium gerontici]|uniref:Secreted protein n=1 Tax=Corynebacterium gerontici TaxID=2079234 RepID=A0A3G6IYP2_9CORY|nr:hypothetical protein [Corynebacterium gerontici]AZA10901.1 hypothetical protein CGERO_02885 [Corynebacterium gerontici]